MHRPESPTQKAISLFLLLRGEALHRHSVEEEIIFLSSWREFRGQWGHSPFLRAGDTAGGRVTAAFVPEPSCPQPDARLPAAAPSPAPASLGASQPFLVCLLLGPCWPFSLLYFNGLD